MFQRKTFIRKSKVFPLIKQTGWKPNPHTYRKAVGTAEVCFGAVLAFVPGIVCKVTLNRVCVCAYLYVCVKKWGLSLYTLSPIPT